MAGRQRGEERGSAWEEGEVPRREGLLRREAWRRGARHTVVEWMEAAGALEVEGERESGTVGGSVGEVKKNLTYGFHQFCLDPKLKFLKV